MMYTAEESFLLLFVPVQIVSGTGPELPVLTEAPVMPPDNVDFCVQFMY